MESRRSVLPVAAALACWGSLPAVAGETPNWRIAFNSARDGDYEVYVMEADGSGQKNLSRHLAVDWVYAAAEGTLFVVSTREERWQRPDYDLYAQAPRGWELRRITDDFPVYDSYLGVSPGGDRLAVCSRRDGDREIYVVDRSGDLLGQLTDNQAEDSDPDWSPDGEWIIFRSDRGGVWDLWLMGADGSEPRKLTEFAGNDEEHGYGGEGPPRWSPDGSRILWWSHRDGDWDLYVVAPDGSGLTALTDTEADEGRPSWSPDGRWIAFNSNRDGLPAEEGGEENHDIYVMGADGSDVRRLTTHPAMDLGPVWIPDGAD